MKQIILSDFTGGINEVQSPDDFTSNQWALLHGFVPRNADSFESQWPIQSLGAIGESWVEPTFNVESYFILDNVVTVTMLSSCFYHVGDSILFDGAEGLNGLFTVSAVTSGTEFKFNYTAADLELVETLATTVRIFEQEVSNSHIVGVFPLQSPEGDYLVATKSDGSIWWTKTPADNADYITTGITEWNRITVAKNQGYEYDNTDPYVTQPDIEIERNPDYRFISEIPFEVYKYIKTAPAGASIGDFTKDEIVDSVGYADDGTPIVGTTAPSPRSAVPAVLLHSRRFYDEVAGEQKLTRTVDLNAGYATRTQTAVIAYVDPYQQKVLAVTFPNIRRWPTHVTSGTGYDSVSSPIVPTVIMSNHKQSGVGATAERPFINKYPFPQTGAINNGGASAYPKPENTFHPYTWLDKNKVLHPGSGFIPRGNVGTMWGSHLIIGDIEWRSEASNTYSQDDKLTKLVNHAALGNQNAPFGLRDGNTEPHRGYFYYSESDIDTFDPISVLPVSGTNARITGMHQLDNRLIVVTSGGSEADGVFSYSGNLSQLHPYTPNVISNPLSVRKQVIRGGVGTADYVDGEVIGHTNQTCIWSEAGAVIFIDRLGGVFYTNGTTANRLDSVGPRQPKGSTYYDHVASAGKHLLMYRNGRILVNTVIGAGDGSSRSVWTSLVTPEGAVTTPFLTTPPSGSVADSYGYIGGRSIKSMHGSSNNVYAVVEVNGLVEFGGGLVDNGERYTKVVRFALNGLVEEKGYIDNIAAGLRVGTATQGAIDENARLNWHRVGISFTTETSVQVSEPKVYNKSILKDYQDWQAGDWNYNTEAYQNSSSMTTYSQGTHSLVFPAGIGQSNLVAAEFKFYGNVKLDSVSFWHTGGIVERNSNS